MKERPSILPDLNIYQLRRVMHTLWQRRGEVIQQAGTSEADEKKRVALNRRFELLMEKSNLVENVLDQKERAA